jgi:glucose-6-phosphate isomerase
MLPRTAFRDTHFHQELTVESIRLKEIHLAELYLSDPHRFEKYNRQLKGLHFDFSKQKLSDVALHKLCEMARECGLTSAIESMFKGEKINLTENRAVLHTALRRPAGKGLIVEGEDVVQAAQEVLSRIKVFSEKVNSGQWKGATGKEIKHIVNIGIGGSDLGPAMVCEALKPFAGRLKVHFVSNVDGAHLHETLQEISPEETLFIVVSKTFTTQETMQNALLARAWIVNAMGEDAVSKHFVAVSTRIDLAGQFGIAEENTFGFWDWVGGRYSLWSAVGLSISLYLGHEHFEALLRGAHEMDEHFQNTEFENNIPVLLALIGVWNQNYLGYNSLALIPYNQYLHRFAAYLQQADMESNGKSIDRNGHKVDYKTGVVVWGEPGTNGQHAFFQLLHQGTEIIPVDFILSAKAEHPYAESHKMLVANCIAQSEAFMVGKSRKDVEAQMTRKSADKEQIDLIAPFRVFEGNRPSSTIMLNRLDAFNLGMLISAYEHKIFVQGVLWNIFSFDQWGVELGKELAAGILNKIDETKADESVSKGLISLFNALRM